MKEILQLGDEMRQDGIEPEIVKLAIETQPERRQEFEDAIERVSPQLKEQSRREPTLIKDVPRFI